ncbi:MAG: tetratricopeptide repeat protein [Hyphomonadaceae bacterium]|nr:tetratricopeptide repeat protein [Hyphomonadaceae bacterium]
MKPARVLEKARALLESGNAPGAEKLIFQTWPSAATAPAEALYLAGRARVFQRQYTAGAAMLEAAIRLDDAQAAYHFALGDVRMLQGAATAAADAFARALQLDPNFPNARRAFARAALGAERFAEAEASARALIAAEPDADACNILSVALRGLERLEEAAQAGAEALKLDPQSHPARHDWAVAVGRLGRVEEALAAFEALARDGVQAGALAVNRSAALLELDRAEEAERVLLEAAERDGADPGVQAALAKARWLNGAGEAFTSHFEQAVARNPANTLLRVGCVDLLRAAGFTTRAEDMLQKGLQRAPSDPVLLDALGVLLDDLDRTAEALPLMQRALAMSSTPREELRSRLARALLRLERADEAMALIAPLRAAAPLNQHWIALECLVLKQSRDPRYEWLCDYEAMVRAYELPAPPGFANIAAFNEALADALMKLHVARHHPLGQTLRDGTQTTRDLRQVDDPVVRLYLETLRAPIAEYIASMREPDHPWSGRRRSDFRLSGAWSVRLRPGGRHVNHIHPAGWVSSSYYVSLPEAVAGNAAQEGWIKFGEPPRPIPGCGVEKAVEPRPGMLVLFPSYVWHGTIPIASGERLTAPFDVVPV